MCTPFFSFVWMIKVTKNRWQDLKELRCDFLPGSSGGEAGDGIGAFRNDFLIAEFQIICR